MSLVYVVNTDMMCFWAKQDTLEPISTSFYDPHAISDPPGPWITTSEWNDKRAAVQQSTTVPK